MRASLALALVAAVLAAGCFGASPDPPALAAGATNGTGAATNDSAKPGLPPASGPGAPAPVRDPPCAFDATRCLVPPAKPAGHAVVAVVDSGINPYHADFAAPGARAALLVPGFPADATALPLSVGLDYDSAVAADAAFWEAVEVGRLYTIPGTRIVGAITFGKLGTITSPSQSLILDDDGHGTGTASAVARASPHASIVVVQAGSASLTDGIAWAAAQPWIDVVSVSWGTIANAPTTLFSDTTDALKAASDAGKLVVVAAGNEPTPAATGYSGPTWVVSVGGSSPEGRGETWIASKGVDVVSDFSPLVARHDSADGTVEKSGTSFAAPTVAGALAEAWYLARAASLPADAASLRSAMNAAAVVLGPADYKANPLEVPMAPTCLQQGWGYVDGILAPAILAAATGGPAPAKADTALCMSAVYAARAAVWG